MILRKTCARYEARTAVETGFANLFNLIPLCMSPSDERDKMMGLLRQATIAAEEALKASVYYGEEDREEGK